MESESRGGQVAAQSPCFNPTERWELLKGALFDEYLSSTAKSIYALLLTERESDLTLREIGGRVRMSRATVSRAMRRLEDAGYLKVQRTGRANQYQLNNLNCGEEPDNGKTVESEEKTPDTPRKTRRLPKPEVVFTVPLEVDEVKKPADVGRLFSQLYRAKFKRAAPALRDKDVKLQKKALETFGGRLEELIRFVFERWEDLRGRYKLRGAITWGMIWGFRESFLEDMKHPEKLSRGSGARWDKKSAEEAPDKGW